MCFFLSLAPRPKKGGEDPPLITLCGTFLLLREQGCRLRNSRKYFPDQKKAPENRWRPLQAVGRISVWTTDFCRACKEPECSTAVLEPAAAALMGLASRGGKFSGRQPMAVFLRTARHATLGIGGKTILFWGETAEAVGRFSALKCSGRSPMRQIFASGRV